MLDGGAVDALEVLVVGAHVRVEVDEGELRRRRLGCRRMDRTAAGAARVPSHLHPVGKVHLKGVHAPRAPETKDEAVRCARGGGVYAAGYAAAAPATHLWNA